MKKRPNRWEILYGNSRQSGKMDKQVVFAAILGVCLVIILIFLAAVFLAG